MCGIAGIFHLDGRPVDPGHLDTFTDSVAHRGPDGRGVWVDGPIGLGHRRLSILDIGSRGTQPMPYLGGRYQITFNGEVFNFLELRTELQAAGLTFSTETDTEVIVAAYHHWGPDCLLRFNGMWAFGIWDSLKRELFLSRDRFGIKPLIYIAEPRRFAFASEVKSFTRLAEFNVRENKREMHQVLAQRVDSVEETLLEGVLRLPPGHSMLVNEKGAKLTRWWRTLDHLDKEVPSGLAAQAEKFRALFIDAVALRMRSDVPIASALSGGLDSSSVVCALAEIGNSVGIARQARDYQHTFTAAFPGTAWDEREYADAVIKKTNFKGHEVLIDPDEVVESLPQFVYDFESVGQTLLMPLWMTYRAIRRYGISVSLDGHGADEMLAGYSNSIYAELQAHGNFLSSPRRTLDLVRIWHGTQTEGVHSRGMAGMAMSSDPVLRATQRLFDGSEAWARRVSGRPKKPSAETGEGLPTFVAPWTGTMKRQHQEDLDAHGSLGAMNDSLYAQFHRAPLPIILQNFDRCSMAHGIEIRMPFMDWRLVCYAFALAPESKAGGGYTKRILREAMRGLLPEKIRTRKPKLGFSSPMPNWFDGKLGEWVWSEVQTSAFLASDAWNGKEVRDFVAAKRRSGAPWTFKETGAIWRFVHAHAWRQRFIG